MGIFSSLKNARTAPTGVQNQMYGQPSRVPGYSQGLGQAPGQMALPPEPMPIGRPTAVVGGPAYFTPQGYNAPPQPTQAFMPTDVRPDPIGQQFMRQMQSPMGQQFQAQYEATQAPMREAEMAQRAEQQAAQDARFQEMMDRIAELEGQLATPTPSPVPEPEPMPEPDPFVPGGPFPGIPDFIRDLDFSGLPDFLNFDYDDIMRQYNDRESSDRETDARNAAQIRADAIRQNRERVEEPRFTTMPVPGVPRGPVMSIEDLLEGRVTTMPVEEPRLTTMRENMPPPVRLIPPEPFKRGRVTRRGPTGSIEVYDDNLRPPEPDMSDKFSIKRTTQAPSQDIQSSIDYLAKLPKMNIPQIPDIEQIRQKMEEANMTFPEPVSYQDQLQSIRDLLAMNQMPQQMPQPMQELRAGEIMPNSPVVDTRSFPRIPGPLAVPPGIIPNLVKKQVQQPQMQSVGRPQLPFQGGFMPEMRADGGGIDKAIYDLKFKLNG